MPYQTGVVEALHDHGLTVGYCPGWQTRGSSSFNPRGHVVHHDAGNNWTTPPGILIAGRSDLPGPLCNFALGRDGKVWMVAAGRANHAGTGSWRGLVGNSSVWGTEANNRGTGEMWPDVQIDAYARLCAATCDYSGFSAEMVCRHAEWTTRKIDPWGPWTDGHRWELHMSHFRALVARGGEDPDPMAALNDNEVDALLAAVQEINGVGAAFGQPARPSLRKVVTDENRRTRRMLLDVIDAVSAEAGVNPAKVRARLKPETRQALDKVD